MPDGVVLLADVYHPVGVDDAPTILERTPYGRQGCLSGVGPEFAARGYRYRAPGVPRHRRLERFSQLLHGSIRWAGHRRLDRSAALVQRDVSAPMGPATWASPNGRWRRRDRHI